MKKFLLSMASLMLLLGSACNDDNGEGGVKILLPSRDECFFIIGIDKM